MTDIIAILMVCTGRGAHSETTLGDLDLINGSLYANQGRFYSTPSLGEAQPRRRSDTAGLAVSDMSGRETTPRLLTVLAIEAAMPLPGRDRRNQLLSTGWRA